MTKNVKIISIMTIVLLVSILYGCKSKDFISIPTSKSNFHLGTVISIKIYDKVDESVFDKVFDRIVDIENKMSINIDESEVMNINSKAGLDYVEVSDDTFNVIEKGLHYGEISDGHFDITIGPIVKLWNIGSEDARVPSSEEITTRLPRVNYKNVLIDKEEKRVMLKDKDMIIDLGGIAKGYAADEVKKVLIDNGVKHAIINLGGNIYTLGTKPDKSDWKIGVQNPLESRGAYVGTVKATNKSIVTSGVYERFLEVDDKKYHHIINPFTGYPVENNLAGVSIISDKSIDGDGLSTTIFSLGIEKGKELVERLEGVDAVFVTKDKEIYITEGLKDKFDLVNTEFKLMEK